MVAVNPINPLWHRWIYASVSNHLHVLLAVASLELKVDLSDGETAAWKAATTKAQATISGPFSKNRGHKEFDIFVDVFVTLTSDRTNNDYDHIDASGTIANALDQCIIVKDYGATGLIEIGILKTREADSDLVDTDHLRPIKTDDQRFTIIRARYEGKFTE